MKPLVRRLCFAYCVLVLLSQQQAALGQAGQRVSKIDVVHVGPPAASESLIRSNIRVREGDPLQRASVDDDVRNLYATGYFYNIQVAEEQTPEGIKLRYILQGKPTVTDVKFTGNKKYSARKLNKKLTSKVGEPLDERKLYTDSRELEKMYQKVGYQKTTVKPLINIDEATGRGTVTFEINETGKVKIEDVEFIGNDSFKDRKLRKVLKTRRHWWLSWITGSGVLKEDEFEDDKDRLVEFYQNNGHIDFEIKDIKFEYPKENRVVIQFDISEGRLYKVGDIAFQGNTLFTTNDIYEGIYSEGKPRKMQMLVGETFTPVGLNKDVEAIKDFYGSKGYIDTRVNAVKRPNTTTGTMDLLYEIQENDKSFIEKIEIKGNTKTKDKVIRRELAVAPGEVYDMVRVKLSKQRLEGLNYFEKVDTQPEDTDVPNRKNLVIGVEEKNTGNITMGAGLSSVDSVVGFVEVSQGNFDLFKPPTFTGAGQKFRARVALGTRRKDYQITFIEPWFLGRKLALGVDLYHRELSFLSRLYDEERTGASVSLTRALWSDFLIGKVGYTIENVGLDFDETQNLAPDLLAESGTRLVSKMTASLAYDTRDHALMPTRGQRSEILSELAGGPFGADTDFYKVELKTTWYFPGFAEGHVFEIGGRSGVVERYGESDRVPLFDRWFLGGAYSLRGYRFRQVGPRDSYGQEPIGGRTYWYGSAEYSIPIIERLRFAMFYDIGNVYRDAYQWDFADYADNWGVGLRINLPIGPLVLDYGVPISAPDYIQGGSGRFNFRVGYSKDF